MPAIPVNHNVKEQLDLNSKFQKLIGGISNELIKRDVYWSDGTSNPARYAFFAFFVAAVIIFLIMICFVNAKRMRTGRAPIITSYLAPPSYNQSQVAYEGQTATNLPTYTENANPQQDVGFYDKNGNFIPAKTQSYQETTLSETTDTDDIQLSNNPNNNNTNNQYRTQNDQPEIAYTNPSITDPQPSDMVYRRPDGPPPSKTYNTENNVYAGTNSNANTTTIVGTSNSENDTTELPPYQPPETPLPTHYKN